MKQNEIETIIALINKGCESKTIKRLYQTPLNETLTKRERGLLKSLAERNNVPYRDYLGVVS